MKEHLMAMAVILALGAIVWVYLMFLVSHWIG